MQNDNRDVEMVIQAAAQVLSRAALTLIERDPHQWSTRPCTTCKSISIILGEPFGCIKRARQTNPPASY